MEEFRLILKGIIGCAERAVALLASKLMLNWAAHARTRLTVLLGRILPAHHPEAHRESVPNYSAFRKRNRFGVSQVRGQNVQPSLNPS